MGNEQLLLLLFSQMQTYIFAKVIKKKRDKEGNTSIEEEIYGEKGPEKNSS